MSGTTPRGYRYPSGGDTVQVPVDMRNLATDVDNDVAAIAPRMKQVQRTGTGQVIPDSSAATLVGFNTVTLSVGSNISYTAGVYTVDFDGAVEAVLSVLWTTVGAAHRTRLRILKNGTQTPDGIDTKWYPAGTGGQTGQEVVSRFAVAAGDTISQEAYQDSGASVTIADNGAVFFIRRIA